MKTMYATTKGAHSGLLTIKALKVILQGSRREAKDTEFWRVHNDLVTALSFNIKRATTRIAVCEARLARTKEELKTLQDMLAKQKG